MADDNKNKEKEILNTISASINSGMSWLLMRITNRLIISQIKEMRNLNRNSLRLFFKGLRIISEREGILIRIQNISKNAIGKSRNFNPLASIWTNSIPDEKVSKYMPIKKNHNGTKNIRIRNRYIKRISLLIVKFKGTFICVAVNSICFSNRLFIKIKMISPNNPMEKIKITLYANYRWGYVLN